MDEPGVIGIAFLSRVGTNRDACFLIASRQPALRAPDDFGFRAPHRLSYRRRIVRGSYVGEQASLLAHHADAGQHVEMNAIVLAADEKKYVRHLSIESAEGKGMSGLAEDDEGIFEHERLVLSGVQQGYPVREGCRA